MKRTYSPKLLLGSLRLDDSWVMSSLILLSLILIVGLFGYETEFQLQAREDAELFPIGRIQSLLIGIAIYSMMYIQHMQWLHWNWFNVNNQEQQQQQNRIKKSVMEQRQELENEEKAIGLWLLAQQSIYALLIILDLILVQSARLTFAMLGLLVVFLFAMLVLKKITTVR
jgi:hypothetical protein